jgi:PAS domain S-box-containing protein
MKESPVFDKPYCPRGGFEMAGERLKHDEGTLLREARLWRERYRVLFERNVAGVVLTTPEGRIMDCNEVCARIFGFYSPKDMLAHSAWDFYFHRAERKILMERLRTRGNCPAEEVCLRAGDGAPVWVLATRTVASFADGVPKLLQGTLVDITAQKKAQPMLRAVNSGQLSAQMPKAESAQMAKLSLQMRNILRRVSKSLELGNLSQMDRAEMRECFLALEQTKMLMSELEILRVFRE